jgi:Photosynthetic reaction centre cytochrome C subunit
MKKIFTVAIFFVTLVMMSFIINKEAPPGFKNLKVLSKNTTKEEMDSLMHHFANSLGQKCGFCHVFNEEQKKMDFASDAKKEKGTAREMWLMTAKLNKKYFDIKDSKRFDAQLEVTCFTCHRGAKHPETKAPVMRMGPPPGGNTPTMPAIGTDTTKH